MFSHHKPIDRADLANEIASFVVRNTSRLTMGKSLVVMSALGHLTIAGMPAVLEMTWKPLDVRFLNSASAPVGLSCFSLDLSSSTTFNSIEAWTRMVRIWNKSSDLKVLAMKSVAESMSDDSVTMTVDLVFLICV